MKGSFRQAILKQFESGKSLEETLRYFKAELSINREAVIRYTYRQYIYDKSKMRAEKK